MLRRKLTLLLFAILLTCGSVQAQTDSVYFEGCGWFTENEGCIRFHRWNEGPNDFAIIPVEMGDFDLDDGAYISGYYDPSSMLECGAYQMYSNTIVSCTWTGCCRGHVGDLTGDDFSDIGDLTKMIDYLFISFLPVCIEQADVTGDGVVDIADLTAQISCLFITLNCWFLPCPPDA